MEWTAHKRQRGGAEYQATGYLIRPDGMGGWVLMAGGGPDREYKTLSAAKRAAQRHHERRAAEQGENNDKPTDL